MRKGAATAGVGVVIALTIACDRSATAPSPQASPRTSISGLAIRGPERLAPGETARFTAIATLSDGSTQDDTQKMAWTAHPEDVLAIGRATGEATAGQAGDAMIWAHSAGYCCPVRIAVLVLPPNTYRLTGQVRESGLAVPAATVTVVSGIGSGLSVNTDYDGQYRLYGVVGALRLRVSKPGYVELIKDVTASRNDVLDFPEARQTEAVPSMSGSYSLTLQPDPDCAVPSTDPRNRQLPADMQQARSYTVQVTQEGPRLLVTAAAPSFLPPSDRFEGRVTPDGVELLLGDGYLGYGPDNAFTAHFSPTQALSYEGQVYATRVGSSMVGRLDGEIQLFEKSTFYRPIGHCRAGNHRFSMSAITGPTR
jgi:hypothetical protein